jgi:hypothetical protein
VIEWDENEGGFYVVEGREYQRGAAVPRPADSVRAFRINSAGTASGTDRVIITDRADSVSFSMRAEKLILTVLALIPRSVARFVSLDEHTELIVAAVQILVGSLMVVVPMLLVFAALNHLFAALGLGWRV